MPASMTRSAPLLGLKGLVVSAGASPHSLLHQGSGMSVNSDYKLTAADLEALKHEDGGLESLPGLAAAAALQ